MSQSSAIWQPWDPAPAPLPSTAETVIVGGGLMGAAVAYYLARAGMKSVVLERTGLAAEASGANAGMIGASKHAHNTTLHLMQHSLQEHTRLEAELDHGYELRRDGRLYIVDTEAEMRELVANHRRLLARDVPVTLLDRAALCRLEPLLAPDRVLGAIWAPQDGHVNPLLLTHALMVTAIRMGARMHVGVDVTGLSLSGARITGVHTNRGDVSAARVVVAAGAWSAGLLTPLGVDLPVRPGQGQMLATEPLPPMFPRVLDGPRVGLRQTVAGNILLGSTVEYVGFDKQVTTLPATFAAHWQHVIPDLRHVRVLRMWAGLRPMSADLFPFIGPLPGCEGLFLATGHGRAGVSWTPVTGLALAQLITTGRCALDLSPVSPARLVAAA